jgi:hypothetical protein
VIGYATLRVAGTQGAYSITFYSQLPELMLQMPLVQSVLRAQSTHWPSRPQCGWLVPAQSASLAQSTHRPSAPQCGCESPAQSSSVWHCTQMPDGSQSDALPL